MGQRAVGEGPARICLVSQRAHNHGGEERIVASLGRGVGRKQVRFPDLRKSRCHSDGSRDSTRIDGRLCASNPGSLVRLCRTSSRPGDRSDYCRCRRGRPIFPGCWLRRRICRLSESRFRRRIFADSIRSSPSCKCQKGFQSPRWPSAGRRMPVCLRRKSWRAGIQRLPLA